MRIRSLLVISAALALSAQNPTPQRSVEYIVEGTVKAASLTYQKGDGSSEQHRVETPFKLAFMAPVGSFVYLSAQKTQYVVADTLAVRRRNRLIDDGVSGTVIVRIKVNGTETWKAESSAAYGIATASGTLK
jgi:hypothetical protein